jgi:ATP-binding cassette subfamily B protein
MQVLRVLWRVGRQFGPLWPWLLALTLATIGGISAELIEPWLHQMFVNRVLLGHDVHLLPEILGLYGAASMAQWLCGSAVHYTFVQSTERFSIRLRTAAYGKLRRLGIRDLRQLSSGEVTAAFQQFGPDVGEGMVALGQSLLASLYRLPASIWLLAHLSGPLLRWTLPALAIYPLYPLLTAGPLRRALGRLAVFDVRAQGVVNDSVASLRARLPAVDSGPETRSLGEFLWRRIPLRVRAFLVDRAGGLLEMVAHQGLSVLLLGLGGMAVLRGQLTVGGLLAFLEYVRGVEGPIRRLMQLPISAQRVAVVAERVFAFSDIPPEVVGPRRGRPARLRGEVELRGVDVRAEDGHALLSGINLRIPAGSFCVILGKSGAGKSTLASLLPRYLDPDRGVVLLDGVDARQYDLDGLRRRVALVPQDPVFVRESVVDNVRLACPSATPAQAVAAIRMAHAEELLEGREGRVLHEAGGNLSGGQRQRLALARGYLQDPAVLVLDEATSALDPALARQVLSDLLALRGRRTLVWITHQEDLAQWADLVVRVEDGRVVSCGPPARRQRPRSPA